MRLGIEEIKELGAKRLQVSPDRVKVEIKHLAGMFNRSPDHGILKRRDLAFYVLISIHHQGDSLMYSVGDFSFEFVDTYEWSGIEMPIVVDEMKGAVKNTYVNIIYYEVTAL